MDIQAATIDAHDFVEANELFQARGWTDGLPIVPPSEALVQKIAAEVKGFDPATHFDRTRLAMLDRVSQFAVVAAREARRGLGARGGGECDAPKCAATTPVRRTPRSRRCTRPSRPCRSRPG